MDEWMSTWVGEYRGGCVGELMDKGRDGLKDDRVSRDGGMGWCLRDWLDLGNQRTTEFLRGWGTR